MNKQEMAKEIARKTGITLVDTEKVLKALEETTHEEIGKGNKVQLTGFLTVKPAYRNQRKGFDPIKLVSMEIPETVGVTIKVGEKLRTATANLDVKDFRPAKKAKAKDKAVKAEKAEA